MPVGLLKEKMLESISHMDTSGPRKLEGLGFRV